MPTQNKSVRKKSIGKILVVGSGIAGVTAATALAGATSEEALAQIRQDILKLLAEPI